MNNKLKHKIVFGIIILTITNIITLLSWYNVKISPLINQMEKIKESIQTKEIDKQYDNIFLLNKTIDDLSEKYNIKFIVQNADDVIVTKQEKGLFLFSSVVEIQDEIYLINAYMGNNFSIFYIIFQFILFQILITLILVFLIFALARFMILKPVDNIIKNIRNYKLGIKPQKVELNNEFNLIQNEFVNLVDSLEEEKKEQNRIIACISHDIKTPLTSIIGYSNLIEQEKLTKGEINEYNIKINEKSIHIKNILSTFDDYLINKENQVLKYDKISIKNLVKNLENDYKIELKSKNIDFNIKTKLDNNYITMDMLKIKRVFSNIISNSVRHIEEKGSININIIRENSNFKFIVSDNGPGVDEKIINKIFEPLFTTDPSRKISGLGLSICKEFIEMHNGTIKAYNNKGLTIEFTIPGNLNNS